jgi:hypothetical protein
MLPALADLLRPCLARFGTRQSHTRSFETASKGAPFSFAIVTPAVAGPFDLGTVVVRSALYVDPVTAQGRVVSDPLPKILDGIPLDLRDIRV